MTDAIRRWPTPLARDSTNLPNAAHEWTADSLRALVTEKGGSCGSKSEVLNPPFVEMLMGWRRGWTLPIVATACGAAATESCLSKPLSQSEPCWQEQARDVRS